jgi:hypothetical protein
MRKLLIGLVILGGVVAAFAIIKRRSDSDVDGWDSFATDESYAQPSKATKSATEAAKDAAVTATKAAKDGATKANEAAKDA